MKIARDEKEELRADRLWVARVPLV